MSYVPFDVLPDHSRLWIFAADKPISDAEVLALTAEMQGFVQTWLAHGMPVTGSCMMKYNQFLFIAADESSLPTGCSTDEMTRRVRVLGESYGIEFLGMPRVQYRTNETISTVGRMDFAELAKQGSVDTSTVVFDNTITALADLRSGKWETPAKNSWHSKAFEFQN
ncbi:MAG TPA: hypothetical protein VFO76_13295 [Candidatus Kapabacteria bacterium]|nr:hypothetical protein [Candidatus Kapabacteria bacterium]